MSALQLAGTFQGLSVRPILSCNFQQQKMPPSSPTAKRIARVETEKRVDTKRKAFKTAGKSRSLGKETAADNCVLTLASPPRAPPATVTRSDSVNRHHHHHQRQHHQLLLPIGQQPALMRKSSDAIYGTGKKNQPMVDEANGISMHAQQIIQFCLENARGDLSARVINRMAHKRPDFALFFASLGPEHSTKFGEQFRQYLADVVCSLDSTERIRHFSLKYGADQVGWRSFGFKADFFAEMASALTTECVFLDGATHSPTDAFEAWAGLVELMFSAVRDGFYLHVRQLRRCNFSLGYSQSVVSRKESLDSRAARQQHRQGMIGGRSSSRGGGGGRAHNSLEF